MNSEYRIQFTDIVDAVFERAQWLDRIGQKSLADETRLFVYSQVAVAYAHLDRSNTEHAKRLNEIKIIYDACYPVLMRSNQIGWRQKTRMFILKYMPTLHTVLWGKRMPMNLG